MTNNKNIFLGISLLVVLFAVWWLMRPSQPVEKTIALPVLPEPVVAVEPPTPSPSVPTPVAGAAVPANKIEKPTTIEMAIKATRLLDVKTYRDAVAENPHNTPTELIKSALDLNKLYKQVQNADDARAYLDYLRGCLETDTPDSLQAICYNYSQKIAHDYPSTTIQVQEMGRNLSVDVRKILDREKASF